VRELYRERVALERDYASKLQILARKASEKKAKTTASLVLGNEPTKVWDENALRQRSGHRRERPRNGFELMVCTVLWIMPTLK
jgi:Fes/CIP4, and EFC/F-BAR homology domain